MNLTLFFSVVINLQYGPLMFYMFYSSKFSCLFILKLVVLSDLHFNLVFYVLFLLCWLSTSEAS